VTDVLPEALAGQQLAVVDIEGNGHNPPEIIEIAILLIDAPAPVRAEGIRTWLIRPQRLITPFVTNRVHGISNDDVAGSPVWTEVADEVRLLLTDRTLVAHNASVEHRVLNHHLPGWQPPLVLDTQRLAKHVWSGLASYSLPALVATGGLDTTEHRDQRVHRAGYDVWCAWQLLRTLLEQNPLTWPTLVDAAALPGATQPGGKLW
jgi:DNA polymerase III epsilon subunit-like protein